MLGWVLASYAGLAGYLLLGSILVTDLETIYFVEAQKKLLFPNRRSLTLEQICCQLKKNQFGDENEN